MPYRTLLLTALLAAWANFGRAADDLPLTGAVVVVDPGHGGQAYSKSYTGGTRGVASKLTEGELNSRVGLELAGALKQLGATVHLTRVADHRLSREGSKNTDELHARIDYFEHHNCHFFVSVHHNAGDKTASGHTALYKHNAADPTLYEACARAFNDALEGAVPGPKRALIGPKGNYHILRETDVPGTITEGGFQTNPAFDAESNKPDYPDREAAALLNGAVNYWAAHKPALTALRDKRVPKPARVRPRQPPPPSAMRSHRRCGFASRPRSAPGRPCFATDPMPNMPPPRRHSIRGQRARSHAGPTAASADSCFSYRARRACASAASEYPPPLQTRRCHPTGSACRPGSRLRVAARFPERSRAGSSHAPSLGRLCPQRPF